MNKLKILIIAITVNVSCFGQWTQLEEPSCGNLQDVAFHDNYLYSTYYSTIFRSESGISRFSELYTPENIFFTYGNIFFVDSFLFFSGAGDSLRYTYNNGINWVTQPNLSLIINKMISYNNKIYAATSVGLFSSSDSALTWEIDTIGINQPNITDILVFNNKLFISVCDNGFYTFNDTLNQWIKFNILYPNAHSFVMDSTGYIVVSIFTCYHSTFAVSNDFGNSWNYIQSDVYPNEMRLYKNNIIGVDFDTVYVLEKQTLNVLSKFYIPNHWGNFRHSCVNDSMLFINSQYGVFYSVDNGFIWNYFTDGFYDEAPITKSDNNTLYNATHCGMFYSNDNGNSWVSINDLMFLGITGFDINDSSLLVLEGMRLIVVKKSTYTIDTVITFNNYLNSINVINDTIYIGTNDGKIFFSNGINSSWGELILPIQTLVQTVFKKSNRLMIGTFKTLYITDDLGVNWLVPSNLNTSVNYSIEAIIENNNLLYFSSGFGVYYSNDNGSSWHKINHSTIASGNLFASSLLSVSDGIIVGTKYGIYKLQNNQWQFLDFYIQHGSLGIQYYLFEHNNHIYTGTNLHGIWKSEILVNHVNSFIEENYLLSFFPNPVENILYLQLKENDDEVSVKIIDLKGIVEYSGIIKSNNGHVEIDTRDLKKGFYLCMVMTKNGTEYFKFIKE